MMKKTILIAIATTLLCSCNKELDETGNITLPERPISIYTAIQSENIPTVSPQTRAPITGTDAELKDITFYLWQSTSSTIDLSANPSSPSSYTGNRTTNNNGKISFNEGSQPVYDQKENKYAFLVGCWPNPTPANDNSLTWTINGKTDILISDPWCAGTYLAPITGAESGSGASPLTFKHRLAQLEVFCKAAEGEDLDKVKTTWGNIKSIELLDTDPQMTYNYTTNKITYIGDKTNIPLSLNTNESGITAIGDGTATAVGMYAPAKLVILRIISESSANNTLTQTFAMQFIKDGKSVNFEAGKKYTVNILFPSTIKYPQIGISINDWGTNSETTEDLLGGSQSVITEVTDWDKNSSENDNPIEDELGKTNTNKPTN